MKDKDVITAMKDCNSAKGNNGGHFPHAATRAAVEDLQLKGFRVRWKHSGDGEESQDWAKIVKILLFGEQSKNKPFRQSFREYMLGTD